MKAIVRSSAASADNHGTQSLDKAISILVELAERSPVGQRLIDIADATRTSRPTAHRILKRLASSGLVVQERGSHLYKIGPLAHTIDSLEYRNARLIEECRPTLDDVASKTGMTTLLVTRHGRFATCCARVTGREASDPAFASVGDGGLLGTSAAGIAILSQASDAEVEEVLFQNHWTIVHFGRQQMSAILAKIEQTRKLGYCLADRQFVGNVMSLAVPVIPKRGACYMSLAVVSASDVLRESSAGIAALLRRKQTEIAAYV